MLKYINYFLRKKMKDQENFACAVIIGIGETYIVHEHSLNENFMMIEIRRMSAWIFTKGTEGGEVGHRCARGGGSCPPAAG